MLARVNRSESIRVYSPWPLTIRLLRPAALHHGRQLVGNNINMTYKSQPDHRPTAGVIYQAHGRV
jgi:hypothetical protein